ncbi:MAG TPA: XdhC family protein [Bryobacteraceae bacterium]|jgi:xanthine/CO dehydrogenase XdhC/CoxF family maturation factor
MKELEQILQLWGTATATGESAILATVVKTQGSSYRLPGARMLLTKLGQYAGSISGGCLEADLLKKAWWLTEKGPTVRRYDTTSEGEIASDAFGLGCNGIVHVLLERVDSQSEILKLLREVLAHRQPATVAHVFSPLEQAGQRLLLNPNDPRLPQFMDGRQVFVETITPAVRLLIFGAGQDAVPLASLAKYFGWQVFVFDGRSHYARREKFPEADGVTVWTKGTPPVVDHWTAAVVMTHSYTQDLEVLRELAPLHLRYLGLLGPHKRTVQLLTDAGLEGTTPASIHSPTGLDIGADGPHQVALAILAEIQAALNGREGGALRKRTGSIHSVA